MELSFLLKGIIIGFSIAAPVGPIGILCIRRTMQFGRLSGLFTGLGGAVADTFYGIVAAFGFTFISDFLLKGQDWLRVIGGILLLYLGVKTYLAKPIKLDTVPHQTLWSDFLSTFFLTITNPLTIFAYLAAIVAFGVSIPQGNLLYPSLLALGVFIGSALWWLILSEGITRFRKKISQNMMMWVNRSAGILIFIFGIACFVSLFWEL